METPHTPEADPVMPSLDVDVWMRFDLWSTRAWESAQRAVDTAMASGDSAFEPAMDSRVIALLNAAQTAKEFAAMTNPLFAAANGQTGGNAEPHHCDAHEMLLMMLDEEE